MHMHINVGLHAVDLSAPLDAARSQTSATPTIGRPMLIDLTSSSSLLSPRSSVYGPHSVAEYLYTAGVCRQSWWCCEWDFILALHLTPAPLQGKGRISVAGFQAPGSRVIATFGSVSESGMYTSHLSTHSSISDLRSYTLTSHKLYCCL